MPARLEIRDGVPHWWNSPDIWVVPGADPNGAPGQPIAGETAYVWGRAHNTGDQPVSGARVNFYWSNPAAGVLRSNSTSIGSAFVDLDAGETKEVLCIVPWVPVVVNSGHECIVAEIVHAADPLPTPLTNDFAPPHHRQIAQKNLTVLQVAKAMLTRAIQFSASRRQKRLLHVSLEFGGTLDKNSLVQAGLKGFRPAEGQQGKAFLSLESGCCNPKGEKENQSLRLSLEPGAIRGVYLKVLPQTLKPKTYVLLHVISREDEEIVGGITYILINAKEA